MPSRAVTTLDAQPFGDKREDLGSLSGRSLIVGSYDDPGHARIEWRAALAAGWIERMARRSLRP